MVVGYRKESPEGGAPVAVSQSGNEGDTNSEYVGIIVTIVLSEDES